MSSRSPSRAALALLALIPLAKPVAAVDDGDPDPRWGASGFARVPQSEDVPMGLACASSGRCWLTLTSPSEEFYLFALTPAGQYQHEGFAPFDLGGALVDDAHDVAVGADGRPVLAGTVEDATDHQFGVARFVDADALDLDDSFSTDGLATMNFAGDVEVNGVASGPSGEVVAVGCYETGGAGGLDFAVVRFLPTGLPDNDFDGNGVKTIAFDLGTGTHDDCARAVTVLPDGRIVVVGWADYNDPDTDFAVVRLTANGGLDPTFDGDGKKTVALDIAGSNLHDVAEDVAVDRFGRIVIAGWGETDTALRPAVVRLTSTGSPDTSFSGDGRFYGSDGFFARALGVELTSFPSDRVFYLTSGRTLGALTDAGQLDATFGDGGVVVVTDPDANSTNLQIDLTSLAGMPVVLGAATHGTTLYEIVARYWTTQIFGDDFESGDTNAWRGW